MSYTSKQQDDWLDRHSEYDDYKGTFYELRNNGGMRELFEIPFLFRLIVHSRFSEVSTNVVELYGKLFKHLMSKRNVYGTELEAVIVGLEKLAYGIYCDNTDTVLINKAEIDTQGIIILFYLKRSKKGKVGFYHRSFYQYFLARFIYDGILKLTGDQAETYISYFAERVIDDTVFKYLSLMIKEEEKETIYSNLKLALDALVRTEAYLSFEPRCSSGDAEKKRIIRSENIVRNTLKLCAAFDYVIQIPFKDNIDILLRTYPCRNVRLCSNDNQRANLNGANLNGANLKGVDLNGANLKGVDLIGADLSGANLSKANLSGANLSRANLSRADLHSANLSRANLGGAYLIGANLSRANLSRVYLGRADLSGADLSRADLSEAYLSGVYLSKAFLGRANLHGPIMDMCRMNNTIIGAHNKKYIDPSVEGYDTIQWL